MRRSITSILVVVAVSSAIGAGATLPLEPDCAGPAGDPAPGTAAWYEREAVNVYCAEQRQSDLLTNPVYLRAYAETTVAEGGLVAWDPMRRPETWNGSRYRFEEVAFHNAAGNPIDGMLFRPCDASCDDLPAQLAPFEPPYPGVVITHGGSPATQMMYLWAAEGLAEAGYMVLTFQVAGDHHHDTAAALDYLVSTPDAPAGSDVNPRWQDLSREHIGLAGHSAGGVAVSRLGQEDPRVSAIVSWDRAQSSTMPDDLAIVTPAMFQMADFNCQQVPVCLPEVRHEPPNPDGLGNKGEDFIRVSGAGVDSMQVALRAATHLDFDHFGASLGSRYGEAVAFYYTLAWFDRYVAGAMPGRSALAEDALARLRGASFDDSGDVHNISSGSWDPFTNRNVPAFIAGQPVAARVSYHIRSKYFLNGGQYQCEDLRAGCA